jgi:hypothetical protein
VLLAITELYQTKTLTVSVQAVCLRINSTELGSIALLARAQKGCQLFLVVDHSCHDNDIKPAKNKAKYQPFEAQSTEPSHPNYLQEFPRP